MTGDEAVYSVKGQALARVRESPLAYFTRLSVSA